MANITIDKLGPCKRRLTVEIPAEEVKKENAVVFSEIAKTASLPGFRKGKVPRQILETRFKDDIAQETQKRLISQFYQNSLKEQNINPVHVPKISNVQYSPDQPFRFTAEMEVEPHVDVKHYDGIKIKIKKVELEKEEIDRYMETLRESYATLDAVEKRPLCIGDYAIIDYKITSSENKVIEDGKSKLIYLQQNEGLLSSVIPKMEGMVIDESRTIEMNLPDTYYKKEFAGQNANLEVVLREIKQKVLPEITDEFAKTIGNFDSLEALRKKAEEVILSQKKIAQRNEGKSQISTYLIDKYHFDLPQTVVEAEMQHIIREKYSQQKGAELDPTKIRQDAAAEAEKRVKLSYVLAQIAEKENIKVEKDELEHNIEQMAISLNIKYEKLRDHLIENGGIYGLQERILQDKVLDFLYEKAKISEK